jgi:hypothetical protein
MVNEKRATLRYTPSTHPIYDSQFTTFHSQFIRQPRSTAQMPDKVTGRRWVVVQAIIMIAFGVAFVVGSVLHKPAEIGWVVGWALVGVGGWFIPRRFVSGMFVGAAIAMELLILLVWLENWMNPPRNEIQWFGPNCLARDVNEVQAG